MDTEEITSGEIAEVAEAAPASASPAAQQDETTEASSASTRETPAVRPAVEEVTRIPLPDHERVVKGFHEKLDALGWAHGLKREEVEEALMLRRQVLSERSRRSAPTEPQPDVKDERGELFYSPQQAAKWATWQATQIVDERMAELEERLGPIESERRSKSLEIEIGEAEKWPGFGEHIDQITALINERNAQKRRNPALPMMSLHEAYVRSGAPMKAAASVDEQVKARLADEQKKWLQQLNDTTERVNDGVNPARVPAGSRKKESEMTDEELWAHVSKTAAVTG